MAGNLVGLWVWNLFSKIKHAKAGKFKKIIIKETECLFHDHAAMQYFKTAILVHNWLYSVLSAGQSHTLNSFWEVCSFKRLGELALNSELVKEPVPRHTDVEIFRLSKKYYKSHLFQRANSKHFDLLSFPNTRISDTESHSRIQLYSIILKNNRKEFKQ